MIIWRVSYMALSSTHNLTLIEYRVKATCWRCEVEFQSYATRRSILLDLAVVTHATGSLLSFWRPAWLKSVSTVTINPVTNDSTFDRLSL